MPSDTPNIVSSGYPPFGSEILQIYIFDGIQDSEDDFVIHPVKKESCNPLELQGDV